MMLGGVSILAGGLPSRRGIAAVSDQFTGGKNMARRFRWWGLIVAGGLTLSAHGSARAQASPQASPAPNDPIPDLSISTDQIDQALVKIVVDSKQKKAELEPQVEAELKPYKASIEDLNRQDTALAQQWKSHEQGCHEPYVPKLAPDAYNACMAKHQALKAQGEALEKKQKDLGNVILQLPTVKKLNDYLKVQQSRFDALQQQKKALIERQKRMAAALQRQRDCLSKAAGAGDDGEAMKHCMDQPFDGMADASNQKNRETNTFYLKPGQSTNTFNLKPDDAK